MAEHGTRSRYRRDKCRCDKCRAANAAYIGGLREKKKAELGAGAVPDEAVAHGVSGYANWGCRCSVCAQSRNQSFRGFQAETQAAATRHYREWTGPELEVAARTDLSARQVALMLGRTLSAVKNIRRRLRDDPKTINLAGVHPSVADR